MIKSSIRLKLTVWYVILSFIIILTFSILIYITFTQKLYRNIDTILNEEAESISSYITINGMKNVNKYIKMLTKEKDFNSKFHFKFVQLLNTSGEILSRSKNLDTFIPTLSKQEISRVSGGRSLFKTVLFPDIGYIRVVTFPVKGVDCFVQIGISINFIKRAEIILFISLLTIGSFMLGLSYLGGCFFAKKSLSPIENIINTLSNIEENDLNKRIRILNPNDEIGRLSRIINDMLDRLQKAFNMIQQFTVYASHELKTPLSIIKCGMEVALLRNRKREEYRKIIKNCLDDVDRTFKVIDDLLFLVKGEVYKYRINVISINIKILLEDVLEEIKIMAESKNINLSQDVSEDAFLLGEETLLRRLFINLLDNALKYTPERGNISISLKKVDHRVRVIVRDSGIGIPESDLPYIFDKFYRANNAIGSWSAGLGLSISQWIAELHKGTIKVKSKVGEGSIFSVFLPLTS
jgi:signal transduction histidine kinase